MDAARFAKRIEADVAGRHAGGQLIRASASVAANYRAAGVARSHREFIAKLGLVIEEADECAFWLEYVASLHSAPGVSALREEGRQLVRIFTASRNTARRNHRHIGHRALDIGRRQSEIDRSRGR